MTKEEQAKILLIMEMNRVIYNCKLSMDSLSKICGISADTIVYILTAENYKISLNEALYLYSSFSTKIKDLRDINSVLKNINLTNYKTIQGVTAWET